MAAVVVDADEEAAMRAAGRRIALALMLGLLLAIASPVPGQGAAGAASADGHELRGPGVAHPATWLGSYATFGGNPWAWCVDAGRAAPLPGYAWASSRLRDPRTSYLLTRYGPAGQVVDHAAISYLVHTSTALPHDVRNAVPTAPPARAGIDLPGRVVQLAADADAQAGPYRVGVRIDWDEGGFTGIVTLDVLAASGTPASGWAGDVTLSGPVRWADGADATRALVTTDRALSWPVQATGAGTVVASARVNVPNDEVALHTPDRAGVQRLVTQAPLQQVTGSASAQRAPFTPLVVTRTSDSVLQQPGSLTDTLTVSAAPGTTWLPGHSVTVASTLWGPFAEPPTRAPAPPAQAPVAGTVATVVDGPGEWITAAVAAPRPGYYVWTEQIAADAEQTGFTSTFASASETTLVKAPPAPVATAPAATAPAPTAPAPAPPTTDTLGRTIPQLPRTGTTSSALVAGLALLVVGAGLLVVARNPRRRGRHAATGEPVMPNAGWVPVRPAG